MPYIKLEQIADGLYRQVVPYTIGDLSLYALADGGDVLLVDSGDPAACDADLWADKLGGVAGAQVFITHNHPDHIGNADGLYRRGATVHMSMRRVEHPAAFGDFLTLVGFPRDDDSSLGGEYGRYSKNGDTPTVHGWGMPDIPFHDVHEGDEIRIGGRRFQVIETPGHALEHCSLFEPDTGIMFSGDHIIDGIVPIVSTDCLGMGELSQALSSLDKAQALHPQMILPSHLDPIKGPDEANRVINHIRSRYLRSVDTTLKMVRSGGQHTATSIELAYSALFKTKSYLRIPRIMRILACLEYLHDEGVLQRELSDDGAALYFE